MGAFMGIIIPYKKEDPEGWKQQNEEAIQKIHDETLKVWFEHCVEKIE